jgi:hypothetical protein
MIGMIIGIGIGIAIGISIGIPIGQNKKPWHELTELEKKQRKRILALGTIILIIGLIINLWLFFS